MKRIAIAAFSALVLSACAKGTQPAACAADETNRCSCTGGGEGLQQCLPSGERFGACVCADACGGGAACVAVPSLIGKDMDQTGAAVEAAGLLLPDQVDPKGFITVQQIADPPVQVLDQSPPAGTPVKPGTRLVLTVTLPPDQASLGLPNSNFLVGKLQQDTEDSAISYYDVLDPGPFPTRATFADWKAANGFGTPADDEASAIYMTHTDLGFGRHMHMRRQGRRVAFYVDNYPSIEDTIAGTKFFATVAMEWSPGPHGKETDPYFTQFYVFNKKGERITDPILDDHGPKQNPAVCLVCHGGATDQNYAANGGKLNARFIPFDLDAEKFSDRPGYTRADQEAAFKSFNDAIRLTWQDAAAQYPPGDPPPVPQLIEGWYGGPTLPGKFDGSATLPGWDVSPEARDLYHKVFAKSCQTCHAQREPTRNFSTYAKFSAAKALIEQRVFEEGAMPLSERGSLNFWLSYPHQPKILADWLGTPLRSPGKPIARVSVTPSTVVTAGTNVILDASDSQYAQTFIWTQTSGPIVQLVNGTPTASKVSFVTPPRGANLSIQLTIAALGRTSAPVPLSILSRSAPDAPASAIATPTSGTTATVSWTAPPSDGLSPITGYSIMVMPTGAVISAPQSATSAPVGSLQPGVNYTFAVSAVNAIGTGTAANAPLRMPTVPGPPVGISSVSTHAGGTVQVGWTPPADTGGIALTGYTISCSPSGTGSAPANATSANVSGLTNGVSYGCSVRAVNVAGSSAPSLSATATPDGPPGSPQAFTAMSGGGSTWNLAWAPPSDTGGVALTGYRVTWSPATSVAFLLLPVTPTSVTLDNTNAGLQAGTTYTFSVAARNQLGDGVAATTTPPGQPIITSTVPGPTQITLSWNPAAPNGSAITGYTVQAQVAPAGAITTRTVSGSTTTTTVTGLLNCTNYNLTVTATSGGGSTMSPTVTNVKPVQAPDTPTGLLLSRGAGAGDLALSWGASNGRGCTPVQYVVRVVEPVSGPVTLSPPVSSTSIAYDAIDRACPYPAVNCGISPRVWRFQVSATSPGGTSLFSALSNAVTPRVGFSRDFVDHIWTAIPTIPPTPAPFGCAGCHNGTNPLHLDGTAATNPTAVNCSGLTPEQCNRANILARPPVVTSPVTSSYLLTCPTDNNADPGTGLCRPDAFLRHPGGHQFDVGSTEYSVLQQWITDGTQP